MAAIIQTPEASAAQARGNGVRLLSLDGGGVRGLSALLVLEHLMKGLNPEAPPKPCEVFDLIGGTSTGGLIAIMLGRLRMDVSSCIDAYLELSSSVFKPNRSKHDFLRKFSDKIRVKSKFNSAELEQAIKQIVRLGLGDENARFREDSDPKCRVFVCAIRKENTTLARLRSYKAIRDVATVEDCQIWEAGRATSAATSFFDPIVIGRYGESFVDGATGSNNPVFHVVDEARKIWTDGMSIRCLVSIGTGNPSLTAFGKNLRDIAKTIVKISTETENTEEKFTLANPTLLQQGRYFRFNVAHGLEKIGLEDREMKPSIAASTNHYLGLRRTQEDVATCLGSLATQSSDQLLSSSVEDIDTATANFALLSEDEKKCLASFALADYKTYRVRVSKRHPGTLQWFLDHELYKNWTSAKSNLLWVTGNPGCGKTVLSAFLLDQLEISIRGTKSRAVYFFCDDKYDSQRTAEALLRGVIHQLLSATPSLLKHAMPKYYTERESMLTSLDSLWCIFLGIATDPMIEGTYCILDALDECERVSREDLLGRLANYFESTGSPGRKSYLNVILTSRPYESIQNFLHKFSIIRLKIEREEHNINCDIMNFISYEVEKLAEKRGYSPELEAEVKSALEGGADGMFLWVSLIIKDLEETPTDLVAETLKTLPPDLDTLYYNILSKLEKKIIPLAKTILQFVVVALQPLSLAELATACSIKLDDTQMNFSEESLIRTFERNIALCGPILKVQDGIVNLVHQSAKDFLINPELKSDFGVLTVEANHKLANICLTYLSFEEFEEGLLEERVYLPPSFLDLRLQKFKFLGYASRYWPEHVRLAYPASTDSWEKFLKLAQHPHRLTLACRLFLWLNKIHICTELLNILVHFGIPFFLDNFLDGGADINVHGEDCGSALQAALRDRKKIIAKMLLDRGIEVNTRGEFYSGVVQIAANSGDEEMIKLLLDKGADINAQGGHFGNALQSAAFNGNEVVVKLLLYKGADINAQGGHFRNALQAAAFNSNEVVVKLLLNKGADINAQGGRYGNALQAAAFNSNEVVVKLLLEKGAGINAQGGDLGNALQAAAFNGNEVVVKLLLEKGADINAQGGDFENALQAAAFNGNEVVVKLLLNKGADISAQGGHFGNALQAASFNGNEVVVKLLLDKGADINAQGGRYGNALQTAVFRSNEVMVKLLLDRGADINAQGGRYGNVLRAMVERIRDCRQPVWERNSEETPDEWVKRQNKLSEAIIRLLLEREAIIDEGTLSAARTLESQAVIQLLQEYHITSASRVVRAASM